MLTKDEAICIRAVDFSETSQIVTFFTRETGKISAIAKGSKRPKSAFDGPVEIFSHGKVVVSVPTREKLATLTEFQQRPGFEALAGSLFALHCALFSTELLNSLTDEYDPHPELFNSFLQFLKNTTEANDKPDTLKSLIVFQLTLLKEAGLQPILRFCANCKTAFNRSWPQVFFSHLANGLICRDCENSFPDKVRLSDSAAGCLNDLKLLEKAGQDTLSEVEKLLVGHFTETIGKPPKMAKYILGTIPSS